MSVLNPHLQTSLVGPPRRPPAGRAWRILAFVLLTVGYLGVAEVPKTSIQVGDTFPALEDYVIEGTYPQPLRGRLIIVDFWASWCGPCRGTFPLMEELHRRLGKQGLVIVAVNEDKSPRAMKEFLKMHPVTFPVVRDATKKLAAKVNIPILPSSYILDAKGKVLAIQSGERTVENRAAFIKLIEGLLEKQPPATP